jgi:hypothetical protein
MTKEVWLLSVFSDDTFSVARQDSNAGTDFKTYDALASGMLQTPDYLIADVCTDISRNDRASVANFREV